MNGSQSPHVALQNFPIEDGCISMGGKSILTIAEEIGSTPFYIYDREAIKKKVLGLVNALPPAGTHPLCD